MVAVNKMDKPGADPDRVLRELYRDAACVPEDWGGDTIVVPRFPPRPARAWTTCWKWWPCRPTMHGAQGQPQQAWPTARIVEAKLDKGRGPVATVLVQERHAAPGRQLRVPAQFYGRVRALMNDQGKQRQGSRSLHPCGGAWALNGVPEAGEEFIAVADEKLARQYRRECAPPSCANGDLAKRIQGHPGNLPVHAAICRPGRSRTLNLVLKADVQGSLEAITRGPQQAEQRKRCASTWCTAAPAPSPNPTSCWLPPRNAIIIGFNVRPTSRIKDIAERENVDIRFYDIIYKLVDDIKSAMAGLLAPVQREVYLGQAEVRNTFKRAQGRHHRRFLCGRRQDRP